MLYRVLAQAYDEIESTSGTLDKIQLYSNMLKDAEPAEINMIVALTMGKLYPDWKSEPEIGIAEKMAIQVVATAASVPEKIVVDLLRETGDIGSTGESLLRESAQATLFAEDLTVSLVYNTLAQTARLSGSGSNKAKVSKLAGLLTDADPVEAARLNERLQALGGSTEMEDEDQQRMRLLLEEQVALYHKLEDRLKRANERRTHLTDMLRSLWLQTANLRAQSASNYLDNNEITGKIRAVCEDIERHVNATEETVKVLTPSDLS